MSDLERRLLDLCGHLDAPDVDLSPLVARRIATGVPAAGSRVSRRVAALVVALASVTGAAIAGPAVADWLSDRIGGVEVRREPPPAPLRTGPLRLGEEVTASEAKARTGLSVPAPAVLGAPYEVWVDSLDDIPIVSAVYSPSRRLHTTPSGVGALVQVFRAGLESGPVITKFAGDGAIVERVSVRGAAGLWLEGAHGIGLTTSRGLVYDDNRLSASALVWERDGLTFRLESALDRSAAIAIAETIG